MGHSATILNKATASSSGSPKNELNNVYMCVCACVCVYGKRDKDKQRERQKEILREIDLF